MVDSAEYIKLLIALLAILDMHANAPIFLKQTCPMTPFARRVPARTAVPATCIILSVFGMLGEVVSTTFGITLAASKVLGGFVAPIIAFVCLAPSKRGRTGQDRALHSRAGQRRHLPPGHAALRRT